MPGESPWRLALHGGVTLTGMERAGGAAPAGVFIHGFRSHCDGDKARRLSEAAGALGCPWLRYDQRGCGGSSGEFRRFTLSRAIADVSRVLDVLEAPRFVLAGSSLGALIALHAAGARTHRVDGLLLIAPALWFPRHFIQEQLSEAELTEWQCRGYRWFPDLYAGGCYRLDYDFCADAMHYCHPPETLHCRVRVLHGTRDELLPWRETRDWVERLDCPNRTLEIIQGGDHRLTEWSDVITRHLETLINEVRQSCA